jgi:hypothetical protein
VAIRRFLNGQNFDAETTRLVGIAFEMARAAITRPAGLTQEIIAERIIELARAGERNVDVLCESGDRVAARGRPRLFEPGIVKGFSEGCVSAVRERIRPTLAITRDKSVGGHGLHSMG